MAAPHKTRKCRFYSKGACALGEACTFAHHRAELKTQPDRHKTHACLALQRKDVSHNGTECKYARGEHELRSDAKARPTAKRCEQAEGGAWKLTGPPPPTEACLTKLGPGAVPVHIPLPTQLGTLSPACSALGDMAAIIADGFETSQHLNNGYKIGSDTAMYLDSEVPTRYQSTAGSNSSDGDAAEGVRQQESTKVNATDELLRKTRMCKFFAKGLCAKGDNCGFAHEESLLRAQPDLYRTRLCSAFFRNGSCKSGDACVYAHGKEQLRPEKSVNGLGGSAETATSSVGTGVMQQEKPASAGAQGLSVLNLQDPFFLTYDSGRVFLA